MEQNKQNFLNEALSDGERTSFGRLGSFIALWFVCAWISILVWRVQAFTDLPNLAIFIGACGAFITVLYGFSKVTDAVETVKTKRSEPA